MARTLVFGGARSGKSAYAERLASASGKEVIYIATAPNPDSNDDSEMASRIVHHRQQRPGKWITVEEPLALAETVAKWSAPQRLILVDCLTLWLSNLLFSTGTEYPEVGNITLPAQFHQQRLALLQTLAACTNDVILVSNEVGMGIVPVGAINRSFADEAGRLNQEIAAVCDRAVLIAAGLPLYLKGAA